MAKITLTLPITGGEGGGNTNLAYTASPTQGTVNSDTGTDAIIPLADATNAGLLSPAEKVEIASALQPGDITQYTDEQAQDAAGTILVDTTTIDLSYNDGTPSISADIKPNSIDATHLSNSINISEFVNDSGYSTTTYVNGKVIDNISGGSFNGIFDMSTGKNTFYDDYVIGTSLILGLNEDRVPGSICTVRIKGGLITYLPLVWNFSGELITNDITKLNEITVLYTSDEDIRAVNRVVVLENPTKWLISGYSKALFPIKSPASSIKERDGKIYPSTYGGAGYGNKGLSVKYLPSGVNGSIVFKKETALDSDVVIGFHDSNAITSFSSIKVAMYLDFVSGRICRFESGSTPYTEVAVVGYYFKLNRTGSTFTLQKSVDGITWVTISTYTYTNSSNMYLVVDINNSTSIAPNEMYYPQTIGLI